MRREDIPPSALVRCTSCHAECIDTTTEPAGRTMLVEIEEGAAGGNLKLRESPTGSVKSRVMKPGLAFGNRTLHLSHFANCPNAATHRNPRRGNARRAHHA